ncbi:MAG TPA: TMEM175 family protein [Croceibacterium sp.]|jgi:uncharacterized membrane protein
MSIEPAKAPARGESPMSKSRLELFSDGVFAIVLTLLVLNLKVPASHGLAALQDILPALVVHAASFFLVGVLWMVHHGSLARVDTISNRSLFYNLLILFWVTLLPFAAENAADRPLEPLGASLIAFCCGAYLVSFLAFRLSVHSTIDDMPEMQRWRRRRLILVYAMIVGNFACAALAWLSPWIGYAAAVTTVLLYLTLRSPPEAVQDFIGKAASAEAEETAAVEAP